MICTPAEPKLTQNEGPSHVQLSRQAAKIRRLGSSVKEGKKNTSTNTMTNTTSWHQLFSTRFQYMYDAIHNFWIGELGTAGGAKLRDDEPGGLPRGR